MPDREQPPRPAPATPTQPASGAGGDYGLADRGDAGAPGSAAAGSEGVNPNAGGGTGEDGEVRSAWHYREFTDREYDVTRDFQDNANYGRPSGGDYGHADGGQRGATGGEAGHAASGLHGAAPADAPPPAAPAGGEPPYAEGSHSRTSEAGGAPDPASDYGNAGNDAAPPPTR